MADIAFVGSVVEQNGDKTTIALDVTGPSASDIDDSKIPPTITVGAATYAAYEATVSDILVDDDVTVTVSLACERANTKALPTCIISTAGFAGLVGRLCSAAQTIVAQPPATSVDFCSGMSDASGVVTTTLSGDEQYFINEFPLTITAGTEKLSAAATATASSASATASGSHAPASGSVSGSGMAASTGSLAPGAASASASVSHSIGAAASIQTAVPALAGMGAAVAAFFL